MILTPKAALELAKVQGFNANGGNKAWQILDKQEELLSQELTKEMFVNDLEKPKRVDYELYERGSGQYDDEQYQKDLDNWQAQEDKKYFEGFIEKKDNLNAVYIEYDKIALFIDSGALFINQSLVTNIKTLFDLLYEIEKHNRQFIKPEYTQQTIHTDGATYFDQDVIEVEEYESKLIQLKFTDNYTKQLIK